MILQRDYRLLLEEESNLFILSMRIEFTIFLNKFVYTFHREERYSIYIAKNYRRTRNFLKIEFIKISTDVSIYWNFKGKTFDRLVLLKKKKVNFFFPKFKFQLFQKVKNENHHWEYQLNVASIIPTHDKSHFKMNHPVRFHSWALLKRKYWEDTSWWLILVAIGGGHRALRTLKTRYNR